jgi:hypothetical protein
MPYKKVPIYITSKKLLEIFKISAQELEEIEIFFDNPDNKWKLQKEKNYKLVVQSTGLREYTELGAYKLARYLQSEYKKNKRQNFWEYIFETLQDWLFQTKKNIRRNFVRRRILNNSSSLVKRNNTFFLSRIDTVRIFETKSEFLSKMHEKATKFINDPLLKLEDFDEIDGILYYSLAGIPKLSHAFYELIRDNERKEWCQDVGEVLPDQVDKMRIEIEKRHKNIIKRKDYVRNKRDKNTCQITKEKKAPASDFTLAVHHLYMASQYPHLADDDDNLITLKQEIHDQFHVNYMGGKDKCCTIDNFIDFVQKYYPENSDVIITLEKRKLTLGEQEPLKKRPPHVLLLPISRVT